MNNLFNEDNNQTNVIRNNDGSMIFTRNILTSNANDLQSQLQSLFSDMHSSILYDNVMNNNTYDISNVNTNIDDISNN